MNTICERKNIAAVPTTCTAATDPFGATLEAICAIEEYGDWCILAPWSDRLVKHFEADATLVQQLGFSAHRERLAGALAYENVHGRGSLLNTDHPRYLALKAMIALTRPVR